MSDSIQCLCCYSSLESHTKPPSRLTLGVIGQQLVECSMGCNRAVKVGFYQKHLQSQCQSHYEHSIHSPSRTTVLKILDRQVDAPTIGATMHLLEDHTVSRLKRWLLGAGLMGEQGAESIHSHVKKLEANYSGITNRLDMLKYFNEYTTAPCLQNLKLPLKRRKTS